MLRSLQAFILHAWRFIRLDMWRFKPSDLSPLRRTWVASLRVLYMSIQAYLEEGIGTLAGSLTYSTVLSVVPMLAVIIGIAKGFGLQGVVREALTNTLPGHDHQFERTFTYVENYLGQVQGGLFIGLGLLILFYTVLMLISTIEDAFNKLWQAPYPRSWSRRIVNYFGAFILLPLILTVSSGTTLFLSTLNHTYLGSLGVISTLTTQLLSLVPYVLITLAFTGLYFFVPNVRVRFVPALIAGVIAGIAFQLFQGLYISGVLWISKYNAIYGSFAAVLLALLWMQLSWLIVLLGAQISYAIQHVWHFNAPPSADTPSRYYQDLLFITLTAEITARYSSEHEEPYRAETLAAACDLPLRQTQDALSQLRQMGLIIEVNYGRETVEGGYYHPNIPPERFTLALLLEAIDRYGSTGLELPEEVRTSSAGKARNRVYRAMISAGHEILVVDLAQG